MLGNAGGNMYIDRYIECLNNLQQKRMNGFTGFETALHHTHLIKPMIHGLYSCVHTYLHLLPVPKSLLACTVDHAFRNAKQHSHRGHDVFTKSMAFETRKLQDMFKRRLGTDVSNYDPSIPFWHTGNPVNMHGTDWRRLRPWEWIWRAASGQAPGRGRAEHHTWQKFVETFIENNLFAF